MSVGENVEEALRFLGLSSNEVKAYITLLQGGSMTASEVSRQARIPYSKVYEALESLRKKGIVSQQRSRPVVFTPKPQILPSMNSDLDMKQKERKGKDCS